MKFFTAVVMVDKPFGLILMEFLLSNFDGGRRASKNANRRCFWRHGLKNSLPFSWIAGQIFVVVGVLKGLGGR